MIDEWISAPYEAQQADRPNILDGMKWLEAESNNATRKISPIWTRRSSTAICDDICYAA